MPISYRETIEYECDECHARYVVDAWLIVDAEERRDLWEYCRQGTIHTVACPNGHIIQLGAPLLLHDGRHRHVLFSPFSEVLRRYPTEDELDLVRNEMEPAFSSLMHRLDASLQPRELEYLQNVLIVPRDKLKEAMAEIESGDDLAREEISGSPHGWDALVEQIDGPYGPKDMPERIQLIETALQTITRETYPVHWAWLQWRLGTSYGKNSVGDPDENVERSIAALNAALTVYNRTEHPNEWADQQTNLSTMYLRRRRGETASDLRAAIAAAQAALSWYSKERDLDRWEIASRNLEVAESELDTESTPPGIMEGIRERYGHDRSWLASTSPLSPTGPHAGRLGVIFDQLEQLQQSHDTQQRIWLLEEAIGLVDPVDDPWLWATLQIGLGDDLVEGQSDPSGARFERAIVAYRAALVVLDPIVYPNEWSAAYLNLGGAYFGRTAGDREQNLQRAIHTFRKAIQILGREGHENAWAKLHYNLGMAYLERQMGDPDQNLAEAVRALREAQTVFTPVSDPRQWALIEYEIGRGYAESLSKNRAGNYEEAIKAFEEALTVYTRKLFRMQWANIQQRLGYLYARRPHVSGHEHYDRAIQAFQAAQTVFTKQNDPKRWAQIQVDLAWPYHYHTKGDLDDNKERALEAIQEALKIYTREADPEAWADAQIELGMAHLSRSYGEPTENDERAIEAFRNAQTVYTRETHPLEWAVVQGELGYAYYTIAIRHDDKSRYFEQALEAYQGAVDLYVNAGLTLDATDLINLGTFHYMLGHIYLRRKEGVRTENLERSIAALQAALAAVPRALYPGRWASFHLLLAQVYFERINGDRGENLQLVKEHFRIALETHPPEQSSPEALGTVIGYARVQAELGAWDEVYSVLQLALKAGEERYAAVVTGANRAQVIAQHEQLYRLMVKACLRLDPPHPLEAFLYAEAGRSRLLRDQLGTLALPVPDGVPEAIVAIEQDLLRQLRSLDSPGRPNHPGSARSQASEQISAAREQLEGIWETLRRRHFAEDYVALRRGERIDWDDVQRWLNEQPRPVAILEFYLLDDALIAFVIRRGQSEPVAVELDVSATRLEEMAQQFSTLSRGLGDHARQLGALHVDQQESLAERWRELGPLILDPIMPLLDAVDVLYLVPHGVLHHLPLHALDYAGQPLIDYLPVAYVPSVAVVMRVVAPVAEPTAGPAGQLGVDLVVGNPTGNLPFAEQEAVAIARRFKVEPLLGAAATKERVQQRLADAAQAHLATHALFAQDDPFASGIVLADGILTAREIVAQSVATRLMVLSACQTGVQDIQAGDELVGLARALLYMGVSTLVLSLWRVNDPATANLMHRFYTHLYSPDGTKQTSTVEALQAAIRETRQESPDLYYWAPFVLFGSWL